MKKLCIILIVVAVAFFSTGCKSGLEETQIENIKTVVSTDIRPIAEQYNFTPEIEVFSSDDDLTASVMINVGDISDRPIAQRAKIAYEIYKIEDFVEAQANLPPEATVFVLAYVNRDLMTISVRNDSIIGERITYKEGTETKIYEQTWSEIENNEEWN